MLEATNSENDRLDDDDWSWMKMLRRMRRALRRKTPIGEFGEDRAAGQEW